MNFKELYKNKTVRIVLLCLLALVLLLAVWKVFFRKDVTTSGYTPTAQESRLSILLSEIEGVKGTTVMITERDGIPVSAVVVFQGEDGILIRTRIMEVAASALSLHTRDILVYPANEH